MRNPYPKGFRKVRVPEAASGDWSVQHYEVGRDVGLYNLRLIRDGMGERIVPLGRYTRLVLDDVHTVMSDTPGEAHEHRPALRMAKGHVLLNGLGLGFLLDAILRKPEVEHVTVVEKSADVIKLCGGRFKRKPVEMVHADALEFKPPRGETYDMVWHDIWTISGPENLPEMTKLKRKYGQRAEWQGCWRIKPPPGWFD